MPALPGTDLIMVTLVPEHSPTAAITGFVAGFLISIPVGPVNITIINEGARLGFRWALLIGAGSAAMESIYCALALTGFSAFLGLQMVKSAMELVSFIFLLILSWKYFSAKSLPEPSPQEVVIEQKLHPRSAFMVGFVRVLGNPSVLLLWVTLTATFLAHNWVDHTLDDRISCVLGVAGGASFWFLLLAYAVSRGHGRFSPRVLLRMERVSGALLLITALWIGWKIISQLHQHKHQREHPTVSLTVQIADRRTSNTLLPQTWPDDPARGASF